MAPPMGLVHVAWGPPERADAWLQAAAGTLGVDDAGLLRAAAGLTRRRGFVVGLRSGLHGALTGAGITELGNRLARCCAFTGSAPLAV